MAEKKRPSIARDIPASVPVKRVRTKGLRLTPDTHATIVQCMAEGNYMETAAALVGIDRTVVRDWVKRGARANHHADRTGEEISEDDIVYADFARDALAATARDETECVRTLRDSDDWRAAITRLERRHPKRWGQKISVAVETELDQFFDRLERQLPPEVYDRVIQIAASVADEGGSEEDSGEGEG